MSIPQLRAVKGKGEDHAVKISQTRDNSQTLAPQRSRDILAVLRQKRENM